MLLPVRHLSESLFMTLDISDDFQSWYQEAGHCQCKQCFAGLHAFNEMTATYIQLLLQFKPLTELMPGLYMCTFHMNKTTSVTFFTYVIRYEHLTDVYLPIVTYGSLSVLPWG